MKRKLQCNYKYDGLGFPIIIDSVEMVQIDSEWHAKIDVKALSDKVFKMLAEQQGRLTGNQIKFIRTYLSMSLRKFAEDVVHESHTAVSKWESFGNQATNMDRNIEAMLRLYLIEKINTNKNHNRFFESYQQIKKLFDHRRKPIKTLHIST